MITNYENLRETNSDVSSVHWDMLILDECHVIRNQKTVGYATIAGGKRNGKEYKKIQAHHILALTGTPVVNRPKELWPIITLLDPEHWNDKTFWYFHKRYCEASSNRYGINFNGAASDERLEELQVRLRETILLRRLKKDVLKELPPKIRTVFELEYDAGDSTVRDALQREKDFTRDRNDDSLEVEVELAKTNDDDYNYKVTIERIEQNRKYLFEEMAAIRKQTALAKIPYVIKFIEEQLESCNKIVIAAWHHEMIEAITNYWSRESIAVYGKTEIGERQQLIDKF